jgi:hypothetical protein
MFPARGLQPHGLETWATVKQRGYEGLVAKDERSPYRGGLTGSWLKVKVRYEGVFVVGGILGTADAPEGLLVDERVRRRLVYRGVVEWACDGQSSPSYSSECASCSARHSMMGPTRDERRGSNLG